MYDIALTSTMNHFILLLATAPPMLSSTPSQILLSVCIVQTHTHTTHHNESIYCYYARVCKAEPLGSEQCIVGLIPVEKKMSFFLLTSCSSIYFDTLVNNNRDPHLTKYRE